MKVHSWGHWPKSQTLSLVWDSFQIHKFTYLIETLWFNESAMLGSPRTALNDLAIFLSSSEWCHFYSFYTTFFPSLCPSCGTTTSTWLSPFSPRSLYSWRTSQVTKNPRSSTSEWNTITQLPPQQEIHRDTPHWSPLVWSILLSCNSIFYRAEQRTPLLLIQGVVESMHSNTGLRKGGSLSKLKCRSWQPAADILHDGVWSFCKSGHPAKQKRVLHHEGSVSSLWGSFFINTYITRTCGWQGDDLVHCFIMIFKGFEINNKKKNTMSKNAQAAPALPLLTFQLCQSETEFWFSRTITSICGANTGRRRSLTCCFSDVIHAKAASVQRKRKGILYSFIGFTHTFYFHLLVLILSLLSSSYHSSLARFQMSVPAVFPFPLLWREPPLPPAIQIVL